MARSKKPDSEEKPAPAKKKAGKRGAGRSKAKAAMLEISGEERWRMIAMAAYHKAEKRGFAPGGETDDWLEAEQEIDSLLGQQ